MINNVSSNIGNKEPAGNRWKPVRIRHVQIHGFIGDRIDHTLYDNLLALDWDNDFLRPFREKQTDGGYVGLGKTLEALVRFGAYSRKTAAAKLKGQFIQELIAHQLDDGYLGMFPPEARVEKLWDVHEMAYLILALVADWRYFERRTSLDAATRCGKYLMGHLSRLPLEQIGGDRIAVELATIGLDRALLALHTETGDEEFLKFVLEKQQLAEWNLPIVQGRHGRIEGHAYAYFTRCIAQMELPHIQGRNSLLRQTRRALDFLRKEGGLVISGSCGQTECWHSDQSGVGDLGETCATAYLIRLLDHLLRLEGSGTYGDMMERAITNALFAAQSPDGRRLRYYVPFEGKRVYWHQDTYCCPGNFRRIVSELPEMVFYRTEDGIALNLYTSASLVSNVNAGPDLTLDVETDYPNSGKVCIQVKVIEPVEFVLRSRIPGWCTDISIAVNGEEQPVVLDRGFALLSRKWHQGDEVTLQMGMPWRTVKGFARQEGRVAVMRGPMLFTLDPRNSTPPVPTELGKLVIDPSTLTGPEEDSTVRQGGMSCRVKAQCPPAGQESPSEVTLRLTEFADPDAERTYFRTTSPEKAVSDELLVSQS